VSGQGSCCASSDKPAVGAAIDPVCGMTVDPAMAKHVSTHDGQTFYFCSASCKAKFDASPATWRVAGQQSAAGGGRGDQPAAHDHTHHEDVRQEHAHAVKDPVCGMPVDPQTAKYHADQTYHFCSARCHEKFVADPTAYLPDRPSAHTAAPSC
jgi:Cu+-exporting ATPase